MKLAVAGTGYVGLSLAVLLAQHNEVVAVDVLPAGLAQHRADDGRDIPVVLSDEPVQDGRVLRA